VDGKPVDKKLASLAKTAAAKRAQPYDRDEAIRGLIELGTASAAAALLKRFTLQIDPSITDQEEKQRAFDGIVAIGKGTQGKRLADEGKDPKRISDEPLSAEEIAELRDAVVSSTREYCYRAENLTWPLKVLRALLDDAAYQAELLGLLARFDTEYTRNIEPKINLLDELEALLDDAVREAVEPYLDDVNETVRFHAVETVFRQSNPASLPALVAMAKVEESVRVINKVCDGLVRQGWTVPAELRDALGEALRNTSEYSMTSDGEVRKALG